MLALGSIISPTSPEKKDVTGTPVFVDLAGSSERGRSFSPARNGQNMDGLMFPKCRRTPVILDAKTCLNVDGWMRECGRPCILRLGRNGRSFFNTDPRRCRFLGLRISVN